MKNLQTNDELTKINNDQLIGYAQQLSNFCQFEIDGRHATAFEIECVKGKIERFYEFNFSTYRNGFSPFKNQDSDPILDTYEAVVKGN